MREPRLVFVFLVVVDFSPPLDGLFGAVQSCALPDSFSVLRYFNIGLFPT